MVLFFLIKMNSNKNSIFVDTENKNLLIDSAFNLITGPTGPAGGDSLTMGPVSGSGTPKGATISLGVLSLAPANVINPGIVTTGDQSFVGVKNFNSSKISINEDFYLGVKTNNQYYFGSNSLGVSEGEGCIAIGTNALSLNSSGSNNIALGLNTLKNNQNGSINIAIGTDALSLNNDGSNNIALGLNTLKNNETGNGNVAIGAFALSSNDLGTDNVAIGVSALRNNLDGVTNIAIGAEALRFNEEGYSNVAIGKGAIKNQIISIGNIAIGDGCLESNVTGHSNVAIGIGALRYGDSSTRNIAIGTDSLALNRGTDNIVMGIESCTHNTEGTSNICMGFQSMYNDVGSNNVALGNGALYSTAGSTGINNIAIGTNSLGVNFGGKENVAVGVNSLSANTDGNNNIAIGYSAGSLYNSSNNIIIGNNSACENTGNVVIGNNFTSTTENNIDFVTDSTSRMNFDGTNWNFGGTKYPSALGAAGTVLYSDGLGNASWSPQVNIVNFKKIITTTDSVDTELDTANIFYLSNGSSNTNKLTVPNTTGRVFTVVHLNVVPGTTTSLSIYVDLAYSNAYIPGYTYTFLCPGDGTLLIISQIPILF